MVHMYLFNASHPAAPSATRHWNAFGRVARRRRHLLLWRTTPRWLRLCLALLLLVRVVDSNAAPAQETPQALPSSPLPAGPFPVRSLSPIQLLYFQLTPERAVPIPRGAWHLRFDIVEANILARGEHRNDAFFFDYELTRSDLALQYGLLDRLEVGVEIPLLYTWKGFLDKPIKAFEDATGFKRTIRFDRPQSRFESRLRKDGRTVLRGTSGAFGLGDIALSAKGLLSEEGSLTPAIAARFALKFPTGDDERALGSGEVDVGLGLALEKSFGPVSLYLNTGVTIPTGNPFSGTGIESLPMLATFLTGEYHFTERFSALVQLNAVTPPVRNTGLDIDRPTYEILFGFNWALPWAPVVWQAGLMEDLNDTNRTADFAVFMSWHLFFGQRISRHR